MMTASSFLRYVSVDADFVEEVVNVAPAVSVVLGKISVCMDLVESGSVGQQEEVGYRVESFWGGFAQE